MRFVLTLLFFWVSTAVFGQALEITPSGNVGIGTTTPDAKITVIKDLTSNGLDGTGFRLQSATGNTGNVVFGGASSVGNNSYFQSYKEGAGFGVRALVLNPAGGNVGIGTSNPFATLEIFGTKPALPTNYIKSDTILSLINSNVPTVGNNYNQNIGGIIGFGGRYNDGNQSNGNFALIQGIKASAINNNLEGALLFNVASAINVLEERMRITSTGFVGIGTTSPEYLLHLKGAGYNARVMIEDTLLTLASPITDKSRCGLEPYSFSGNLEPGYALFGVLSDINTAVGISGLVAPASDVGTTPIVFIEAASHLTNGFSGRVNVATRPILGINNNSTRLLTVLPNGNIGIGTSNPDYALEIQKPSARIKVKTLDSTSPGVQLQNNSGNLYLGIDSDTGGAYNSGAYARCLFADGPYPLVFSVNNAEKMRILSNGNVGIGDASPTVIPGYTTLSIKGTTVNEGGFVELKTSDSSAVTRLAQHTSGLYFGTFTAHPLILKTSDAERMRITSGGNVGIGTSTPTSKLDVAGVVSATSFNASGVTLNVPDYVFDKNYVLKSLEEVESSILDKGHLPGVPSANEIKNKGLDMVQMQLKLLEKVEELTLYSIAQNKEIKELKEVNQKLNEKEIQMAALLNRIEKLEKQTK